MKKGLRVLLFIIMVLSLFQFSTIAGVRETTLEDSLATRLKVLGLFMGISDTDFDLNREPSRTEALVMLIRVLGKEEEALSGSWSHPFTDVALWADKYIGYAYQHSLTQGVSSTKFGEGTANAATYLTFVLRSLGYSDTTGADFLWDNPFILAQNVGLLSNYVDTISFLRADVVLVSYAALSVNLKGLDQTLSEKLISNGVFTQSLFKSIYDISVLYNNETTKKVMSASEIYSKCSSAVFSIKTYDIEGDYYSFGSGFFIQESGIAVTNHHVLKNALSAKIILTNGNEFNVSGVLSFDKESDYAIIKVDGSGFEALGIGDSSTILGGETIFAIGSPQGLTNTISNGIVSNPSRTDLGGMIQITAPISAGSSGGALINSYGEVVGVTTASIVSGQNLNFAVPINLVIPNKKDTFDESIYDMFTISEYAEYNEYLSYDNIPKAFDYVIYESEPNNIIADAIHIDNGTSVLGIIDDGYLDAYIIHCNTVGTIEVSLFSDSASKYVRDLILTIRPVNIIDSKGVLADYYLLDDGSAAKSATYIIPRAGTYIISVLSNSLYKSESLYVDYDFYYKFTPGKTTGENSTGRDILSTTRQELAFDALKTWLISNYNKTISDEKAYIYKQTKSFSSWDETGVIYDDANDVLILYYHYYKDGANFYSYLNIEKTGQSFYSGFSYIKDFNYSYTFYGYSTIITANFTQDSAFVFSEYDGEISDKSTFEDLAKLMFLSSIDYANYLFQYYVTPEGSYSMTDFGFTLVP